MGAPHLKAAQPQGVDNFGRTRDQGNDSKHERSSYRAEWWCDVVEKDHLLRASRAKGNAGERFLRLKEPAGQELGEIAR
jgi:hypothetical protein